MSWDAYIDNLIQQAKKGNQENIDYAVIIDKNSGANWTQHSSRHLKLSPDEATKVSNCCKKNDFQMFMTSGVHAGGVKYQFLRQDDKAIYAKKKDHGALAIQATGKAIIVAHCPEGMQAGDANKAVAVVAEYLEGLGY